METKHFISIKAYPAIDLQKTADFFGLPLPEARERSIIIEGEALSEIYKYEIRQKRVHIFSFGCLVFEDMEIDETDRFLEIIQPITGEPDYKMLLRYRESHDSVITEDGTVRLWPESTDSTFPPGVELSHTIAAVLAKSAALSKEEEDLSMLLGEAHKYINRSNDGVLSTGAHMYAATMAHIVRFEKESAAGFGILDRPASTGRKLLLRDAYDKLADYYELDERYDLLEKKAEQLRNIVRSGSVQRSRRQEKRLLVFETFLLMLFPLSHILETVIAKSGIKDLIYTLFTNLLQKLNIIS
jgi:uncharacterized Rmd1/YagE family protein